MVEHARRLILLLLPSFLLISVAQEDECSIPSPKSSNSLLQTNPVLDPIKVGGKHTTHAFAPMMRLNASVEAIQCVGVPCVYKGNCGKADAARPCCADSLFELLNKTADFLEANDIEYYVWAGTLLGGVRDQDIIPYTADIDLAMRYDGMSKLVESVSSYAYGREGDALVRGCAAHGGAGAVEKEFTWNDLSLPYMDVYDIDRWKSIVPYKDQFTGNGKVVIRGRSFPAPKRPEDLLQIKYGDWHTIVESPHR